MYCTIQHCPAKFENKLALKKHFREMQKCEEKKSVLIDQLTKPGKAFPRNANTWKRREKKKEKEKKTCFR